MPQPFRLLLNTTPLLLTTLALAFSVSFTTTRDWAHRHHYDPSLDMKQWTSPLYTLYRSPFILCTPSSTTSGNKTTYTLTCNSFKAFGRGKTSCETVSVTGDYNIAQTGDERLCQQVHMAGNLAIAGTVFVGLGFLLTLCLTFLSANLLNRSEPAALASPTEPASRERSKETPESNNYPHRSTTFAPAANAALILFLGVGAILLVLSQFYGVIAFVQSQPDNGIWAAYAGNNPDPTLDNSHGPWVQGKSVTRFASLGWLCAGLGAVAAKGVWTLPKIEKVL